MLTPGISDIANVTIGNANCIWDIANCICDIAKDICEHANGILKVECFSYP